MSKAFTSEETPDSGVVGRAARAAERGEERPITAAGYRALTEELRRLQGDERPRARAAAGALGGDAILGEIEHRIAFLQTTLASVRVVEVPATGDGAARFGSRVTVERDADGAPRRQRLELVGPDEADARAGRIAVDSPLARALLGRRAGDEVELERPRGVELLRLIDVE